MDADIRVLSSNGFPASGRADCMGVLQLLHPWATASNEDNQPGLLRSVMQEMARDLQVSSRITQLARHFDPRGGSGSGGAGGGPGGGHASSGGSGGRGRGRGHGRSGPTEGAAVRGARGAPKDSTGDPAQHSRHRTLARPQRPPASPGPEGSTPRTSPGAPATTELSPDFVPWAYPAPDPANEAQVARAPSLKKMIRHLRRAARRKVRPGRFWEAPARTGGRDVLHLKVHEDPSCFTSARYSDNMPRQTPTMRTRREVLFGGRTPARPESLAAFKQLPLVEFVLASLEYGTRLAITGDVPTEASIRATAKHLSDDEKFAIASEIGRSMRDGERSFVAPEASNTARARPIVIPKKDSNKMRFLQDASLKVNGERTGVNKAIDYKAVAEVMQTSTMAVLRSAAAAARACGERAEMYILDISRYFRVLPVDRADVKHNLIAMPGGRVVQDVRMSMGSCSSPAFATSISTALAQALERRTIGRAMRPNRRAGPKKKRSRRRRRQSRDPRQHPPLPVITPARHWAVETEVFVDDFACFGGDHEVNAWATMAIEQLERSNFPVSISKAVKQGPPAAQLDYLGHKYDMQRQEIRCPADKAKDVLHRLHRARKARGLSLRHLETLVGKLNFLAAALYGMLPFMRTLYDALQWARSKQVRRRRSKQVWIPVSFLSRGGFSIDCVLEGFQLAIKLQGGRSFPKQRSVDTPIILTDASVDGWGAELLTFGPDGKRT